MSQHRPMGYVAGSERRACSVRPEAQRSVRRRLGRLKDRFVLRPCEHVFVFPRKPRERREAIRLRAAGFSLRQIAKELDISLSSASIWTRGMAHEPGTGTPSVDAPAVVPETEPERGCPRCGRHLLASAFNRLGKGRQWWCRACFKAYYREDRERHRARNDALLARRVAEAQAHVDRLLLSSACRDCGETDPPVLDFDHIAEKQRDVCTMTRPLHARVRPPA